MYNLLGMETGDTMLIDLSEFISTDNKKEIFAPVIESDHFTWFGDDLPFADKKPLLLEVANEGKSKVRIRGTVDVVVCASCSRCLTDVKVPVCSEFDYLLDYEKIRANEVEDQDDISFLSGNSLDVDRLALREILACFPFTVLCREDCKGLCFKCGKNLNEGDCGCDRETVDVRMSAIQDIFKNFKEV